MIVLSLFDGMACGRIALERAGIKVTKYFASEIDKPAMSVAKHNWPDIIHIGDVTKVRFANGWLYTENGNFFVGQIDLIIGGSPCQGFSFAGKQLNFDDPRSKLFFEFVRLRDQTAATYFMLENVVMKKEFQAIISEHLGVEPFFINSALVSAQVRKRLYWTNIPGISLPDDKGIYLNDILLSDIDDKYIHSEKAVEYMNREVADGRTHWDFKHHSSTENDKASCITANIHKGVPYNVLIDARSEISKLTKRDFEISIHGNGNIRPYRNDIKKSGISEVGTVLNIKNKSVTIIASHAPKIYTEHPFVIRKLTPVECERLQTVPDNYTALVSSTQRYKMLGNGWTVDVIAHMFKNIVIIKPKYQWNGQLGQWQIKPAYHGR